jgi:hypothetical protein
LSVMLVLKIVQFPEKSCLQENTQLYHEKFRDKLDSIDR